MTAEQKRIQIMQNLKEGKRPGHLMQGLSQGYKQQEQETENKNENEEVSVESVEDTRPKVRKTLSGRIIGYRGMDPPVAFSSITASGESDSGREEGVDDGDSGEEEGEGLSRVELEMIEYERIKAAKRKRGTLKKNHKPVPVIQIDNIEEEEEEQDGIL